MNVPEDERVVPISAGAGTVGPRGRVYRTVLFPLRDLRVLVAMGKDSYRVGGTRGGADQFKVCVCVCHGACGRVVICGAERALFALSLSRSGTT